MWPLTIPFHPKFICIRSSLSVLVASVLILLNFNDLKVLLLVLYVVFFPRFRVGHNVVSSFDLQVQASGFRKFVNISTFMRFINTKTYFLSLNIKHHLTDYLLKIDMCTFSLELGGNDIPLRQRFGHALLRGFCFCLSSGHDPWLTLGKMLDLLRFVDGLTESLRLSCSVHHFGMSISHIYVRAHCNPTIKNISYPIKETASRALQI